MSTEKPKTIHLKDYKKPDYLILETKLHFDIFEEKTIVKSKIHFKANEGTDAKVPLVLLGQDTKLISVKIDGRDLSAANYQVTDQDLTVPNVPKEFILEIENEIDPVNNKALEGLYKSGDIFCTQNEAKGFRRITYYLDRPDVMSKFTTTVTADKSKYPILLSNGNKIEEGDLEGGRHFVVWEDPFKKPCYLFALVAGDLGVIEDEHTTSSGRKIALKIYMDKGNENRCLHAMTSLKKAMEWDEKRFGLECDLDTYMIVVVDAFNSGAMENKGLNIFNTQCVLADPESATDSEYQYVERVVAHEYFHNWTGNRITCRDWFQLTLKEGLTVFRDSEFSADVESRAVKRISDVTMLRNYQFVEDGGPNAHPIRPASYIDVSNFYTPTVYEKGSEVIRMIQTMIGRDGFRKGIDKYFELYDGQAVTCDDFVHAMELASGMDLTQFKNWYSQAGTPNVKVKMQYDEKAKTVSLKVDQTCPATPENKEKQPFYFPLSVGMLDSKGNDMPLDLGDGKCETTKVLHISKPSEVFVFKNINEKPIPSLLRDFSAPVKLEYEYTAEELAFLLAHDSDPFNRYEAGYRLAFNQLNKLIVGHQKGTVPAISEQLLDAYGSLLENESLDPAFVAEVLTLPSVIALTEPMEVCDFDAAHAAREELVKAIAAKHESKLMKIYEKLNDHAEYKIDSVSIGKRSLKNTVLRYLSSLEKQEDISIEFSQYTSANNMTDQLAALRLLCDTQSKERDEALHSFYEKWKNDPTIINKWFVVQAISKLENTLQHVKTLEQDPAFDIKNPNKIRSLFGAFAGNLIHFHNRSGDGYKYLVDKILEIDKFNPSIAARLAVAFKKYSKLEIVRKGLMKQELERIVNTHGISNGLYEIVSKTLASG